MLTWITWLSGTFVISWVVTALVLQWGMNQLKRLLRAKLARGVATPEWPSGVSVLALAHIADSLSDTSHWVTRASRLKVQWHQATIGLLATTCVTTISLAVDLVVATTLECF